MSDKLGIEERLFANETRPASESHLSIADTNKCLDCPGKNCTVVCPSGTYTWSDEGSKIVISFDNCLECGSCRAICPHSVITWSYPMGGAGICYRYG